MSSQLMFDGTVMKRIREKGVVLNISGYNHINFNTSDTVKHVISCPENLHKYNNMYDPVENSEISAGRSLLEASNITLHCSFKP